MKLCNWIRIPSVEQVRSGWYTWIVKRLIQLGSNKMKMPWFFDVRWEWTVGWSWFHIVCLRHKIILYTYFHSTVRMSIGSTPTVKFPTPRKIFIFVFFLFWNDKYLPNLYNIHAYFYNCRELMMLYRLRWKIEKKIEGKLKTRENHSSYDSYLIFNLKVIRHDVRTSPDDATASCHPESKAFNHRATVRSRKLDIMVLEGRSSSEKSLRRLLQVSIDENVFEKIDFDSWNFSFYRTFDPIKSFEAIRDGGWFQSCRPEEETD